MLAKYLLSVTKQFLKMKGWTRTKLNSYFQFLLVILVSPFHLCPMLNKLFKNSLKLKRTEPRWAKVIPLSVMFFIKPAICFLLLELFSNHFAVIYSCFKKIYNSRLNLKWMRFKRNFKDCFSTELNGQGHKIYISSCLTAMY